MNSLIENITHYNNEVDIMNTLFNTDIKSKVERRIGKCLKKISNITGHDIRFIEQNLYIKIFYKGSIYHTEVCFIQESVQEALKGLPYVYKGVNVYYENSEICLTFEDGDK